MSRILVHRIGCFCIIAIAVLFCGCASVEVRPLKDAEISNPKVIGLRFYRPHPYLQVTQTVKDDGTLQTQFQIIQLPDTSTTYLVNTATGWGTAQSTVALTDGWNLTSLNAQVDSKIPETLTAISGLVTAAGGIKSTPPKPGQPQQLKVCLYRMDFDANGNLAKLDGPLTVTIP